MIELNPHFFCKIAACSINVVMFLYSVYILVNESKSKSTIISHNSHFH